MTFAAVATFVGLACVPGCGGPDGRPVKAVRREVRPSWQDVFDGVPDIYAVVRPQAIKRDALYGSLWKTVVRLAEAKRIVTGPSTLEALEGADEIIVGVNAGTDAAMVLRGVPASLDPQKVTDENGQPLFRLVDERAPVPEYQLLGSAPGAEPGSVFVLPDRTWVGTFGEAKSRARSAFAAPLGRPLPAVDDKALGVIRFGESFVQQPRYVKSPVWGPLTKKLGALTLLLAPGKDGLLVTLHYEEQSAAAYAEMIVKRMVSELATDEKRFGWLKSANVAYDANDVRVRLPLPSRLLEELPNASAKDMPL